MRRLSLAIAVILLLLGVASAHPVETPNDAATIRDVRKDLMSWKGKLVAFRVQVLEVHFESKGQPILKVAVGGAGEPESFWIASLVTNKFSPGDDVFVLGLMTRTTLAPATTNVAKLDKDPFLVMGFCFMNMTKNWGAGEKDSWKLCDEWFKRGMPATPSDT